MKPKEHRTRRLTPTEFSPPTAKSAGRRLGKVWFLGVPLVLAAAALLYFVTSASSLQVLTSPASNISIEGGWHLAFGDRYLLLPGEFRVRAEAPGYRPEQASILVEAGRASAVEFHLTPLPGDLRIAVNPDVPVRVQLDGVDQGLLEQPLLANIEEGIHQLRIDAWLYKPQLLDVEVPGKGEVLDIEIDLVPNWVEYQIETVPAGADVRIDGQSLGTSPAKLKIEADQRQLTLSLAGYRDYQTTLDLDSEATEPYAGKFTFVPLESKLDIGSDPAGAAVTIDGSYRGETPLSVELSPAKPHEVLLFKSGYLSHSAQVTMKHLENRGVQWSLKPDLAEVTIAVSPKDAEIYVDGRLMGTGDQNLSLMTRKQLVEIRKNGFETQSREVIPSRSLPLYLNFSLLTNEQSEWAQIPARYSNSVGQELLLFRDAGLVQLGSDRSETERRANEALWTAKLERAFYVAVTQVTNSQYRLYEQKHSSGNRDGLSLDGPDQPVVNLSWQEVALYCNWLSEKEGLPPYYQVVRGFVGGINKSSTGYRLLTEAEWSWLARTTLTGLAQKYSWGNGEQPSGVENVAGREASGIVNFYLNDLQDNYKATAPVGSFPPNHRGLKDINGNASEWINDWYSPQPYPADQTQIDPVGPEIGEYHVIRGANWARGYLPQLRLAYRDSGAVARDDTGFRVARYAK